MSVEGNQVNYGLTDIAAETDRMGIGNYIDGLTEFIAHCQTPMTMSLQGSWGTGKTSIMKFVENELAENYPKVKFVKFDTWKFSQFGAADQLPAILVSSLIKLLDTESESKKKLEKGLEYLSYIALGAASGALSSAAGSFAEGAFIEAVKYGKKAKLNFNSNTETILDELDKDFKQCVNDFLSPPENKASKKKNQRKQSYDRIVFFIDDLDRLEPQRAVELLEVLNLFMSCEGCVFILAIDYEVVRLGVKAKYKDIYELDSSDLNKGDQFFDKIIQVPLKVPVNDYKIEKYVKQEISKQDDKESKDYANLLKKSIGSNPRSIKRIFNSYQLLKLIKKQELKNKEDGDKILFSIVCMQAQFPEMYKFLVNLSTDLPEEGFEDFFKQGSISWLEKNGYGEQASVQAFAKDNRAISYLDFTKSLFKVSESKIKSFKELLGLSTATSAHNLKKVLEENEVATIEELRNLYCPELAYNIKEAISADENLDGTVVKYMNSSSDSGNPRFSLRYPTTDEKISDEAYVNIFFKKSKFSVACYPKKKKDLNDYLNDDIKGKYNRYKNYSGEDIDLILKVIEACYETTK